MVMSPSDREKHGIFPEDLKDAKTKAGVRKKAAPRGQTKSAKRTRKTASASAAAGSIKADKKREPSKAKKGGAAGQKEPQGFETPGQATRSGSFKHIHFQIVADNSPAPEHAFSVYQCEFEQALSRGILPPPLERAGITMSDFQTAGVGSRDSVAYLANRQTLLFNSLGRETRQAYTKWVVENSEPPASFGRVQAETFVVDDFLFWADMNGAIRIAKRSQAQTVGWFLSHVFLWLKHGQIDARFEEVVYRIHIDEEADEELVQKLILWLEKDVKKWVSIPSSVERISNDTDAFTARTNLESDQASANDYLGFKPLAKSIAAFVKHRETGLPLSVAIDGPWGTGKSSLMLMLQEELDKGSTAAAEQSSKHNIFQTAWRGVQLFYYTVEPFLLLASVAVALITASILLGWIGFIEEVSARIMGGILIGAIAVISGVTFAWYRRRQANKRRKEADVRQFDTVFVNVWRHGHGTRLKAAVMKRIIDRLISRRGPRFFLQLQLARFNRLSFLGSVLRAGVQNAVFLASLFFAGILVFFQIDIWPLSMIEMEQPSANALGAVMSAGAIALRFAKKSKTANMKDFLTSPDYEGLAGPDDEIEEDFERIIGLLKQEGRSLAIFIDDLDRCSPETVHRVVEALNVFFGKQHSECLFILGMHKEMVATSLEVAYEKTAKKLEGNPLLKEQLPYGRRFLEKIVQFAVAVPRPRQSDIDGYVDQLTLGDISQRVGVLAEQSHELNSDAETSADNQSQKQMVRDVVDALPLEQQEQFEMKVAALQQEEKRLQEAATFSPRNTNVANIFAEIRPALRSNPRQYKRFFNHFRFNRFVSETIVGLDEDIAERNDAIIAVIALEYPLLYQWAFEDLAAKDGQRRIEAALEKVRTLCGNTGKIQTKLDEDASIELRIQHTYKYDQQLKDILDKSKGVGVTAQQAAE